MTKLTYLIFTSIFLALLTACNNSANKSIKPDSKNPEDKQNLATNPYVTDTLPPCKFKNVLEVTKDKHSSTWVKIDKDSPSSWLHFNLYNSDTLWIAFTRECWASFPVKISNEQILVYWDTNIDTKYDFKIVKAMAKVEESYKGKPFMGLTLENDSTLKATYFDLKLINKLNNSENDRILFPDKFIATYPYRE